MFDGEPRCLVNLYDLVSAKIPEEMRKTIEGSCSSGTGCLDSETVLATEGLAFSQRDVCLLLEKKRRHLEKPGVHVIVVLLFLHRFVCGERGLEAELC